MLCVCTVNTHWQQADTVCRTKSTYQLDRTTGPLNLSWMLYNNGKTMCAKVRISHPASYNNFIDSAFMCTKATAGIGRGGWMSCVKMSDSSLSHTCILVNKSPFPAIAPFRRAERSLPFADSTPSFQMNCFFCQMTSFSWPAIAFCEKLLGTQEVQLTAFGSPLGNKYLSAATLLTSLILAPSVSQ